MLRDNPLHLISNDSNRFLEVSSCCVPNPLSLSSASARSSRHAPPAQPAPADELADCLYANTSAQDKTTFLQWAYVTLGRTEAAKSVQTIPAAKIKTVEKKAQTTLTQLVMKSCPKPAMNLLLSDPKKGLEKTLTSLAGKLVQAEVEKRTSPLLSMTITDLLKR